MINQEYGPTQIQWKLGKGFGLWDSDKNGVILLLAKLSKTNDDDPNKGEVKNEGN